MCLFMYQFIYSSIFWYIYIPIQTTCSMKQK